MPNLLTRPKICIVASSALSIHFFLREHIKRLALTADIIIFTNLSIDSYVSLFDLPVTIINVELQRNISIKSDIKSLIQLIRLFKIYRFNLVWGVGPKAGLLSMTASKIVGIKKRLFIFQGEVWASKKGLFRFILKLCDKITSMMASHILAVGKSEASFLIEQSIVCLNKIQVLGSGSISGVNIIKPQINRKKIRLDYGIVDDERVILFVGRIHPDKGILDLARAFKKLKLTYSDIHLMIVGPDEGALSELNKLLKGFEDSYSYQGFALDPNKFYQLGDIFCLPSYREGFPISILEASLNSLPVVASNIYGINDAIEDDFNGLLFRPKSIDDLAQKIEQLLNNSKLRKYLGVNGRNRVIDNYERNKVILNYVNYINKLIT